MDLRYATALRNATNAWAEHRAADAMTMQELQQSRNPHTYEKASQAIVTLNPSQASVMQPQLARYGKLGTRLNIFA